MPPVSRHLGQKAAQSLYHAVEQAKRIGLPITHLVTLNFAATNCNAHDATQAFQRLRRHHFNKWATRPRAGSGAAYTPTYFYAFENEANDVPFEDADADAEHNIHVHWAVHIPAGRLHSFETSLWSWFEAVTGGITDGRAIDIKVADNLAGLRSYLLKGTASGWAAIYGAIAQPQGVIVGGRRSNTSKNIGRAPRIAADRALGIRRRIPHRPSPRAAGASA